MHAFEKIGNSIHNYVNMYVVCFKTRFIDVTVVTHVLLVKKSIIPIKNIIVECGR